MSEKSKKSISFILPVYNEKILLERSVERCLTALSESFENFEIILVDDGSSDGNTALLDSFAQRSQNLKVIYNIINLNVGIAVQRAMMTAKCDYVVHNAVDLPLAPEDLAGLVADMKDSDLLILERKSYAGYLKWRLVTSFFNRLLLKMLFPISTKGIQDMNYTQIYRTAIIPDILPLAKSPAFTTPEMIIRAKFLKLKVTTISVAYSARTSGKGAFGKPHDILWSMYDMFRFRIKMWSERSRTLYRR